MKARLAILMILLASCSVPEEARDRAEQSRESVFDPLVGTIDRAEGVEDTLSVSAADRRRQIEESEGR